MSWATPAPTSPPWTPYRSYPSRRTIRRNAAAIRDRETLRFDYRRHDGTAGYREAEPHRLVHTGRRWYLLGWDPTREDWRTYRVDRMTVKVPNGRRFPPRDPPEDGYERHVARGVSISTWPIVGRFLLHAPAEQLRGRHHLADGMLQPVDDRSCLLTTGADNEAMLLVIVGIYDVDFTVLDPPAVIRRAADMAATGAPPEPEPFESTRQKHRPDPAANQPQPTLPRTRPPVQT